MNNINLIGRLTKEAELVYTANGIAIYNQTIAVDDGYGDKKKTYFFTLKWFDKSAENAAQLTYKGQLIGINGKLVQTVYEREGKKNYNVEVHVKEFKLLSYREDKKQVDEISFEDYSKMSGLPF